MNDLRIVIPAYNEEAGIGEIIERVRKACPGAEIIVVNDASHDGTAQIAVDKGALVIHNKVNMGKGGATKIGLRYETGRSNAYFAFIDADGTYPPESIPAIYDLCKNGNHQLVVGARLNRMNEGMPKIRRFGNSIFAFILSFYSGRKTTDTSTGLRVFHRKILPLLEFTPDGLDFDTYMTAETLFSNLAYAEVPIPYFQRRGDSKLSSLRDGWRFLVAIMKTTRKYRPLRFWYTLGVPFLALKFLIGRISRADNIR